MWIIDRYVLRQFVQVFVVCWFSLTGLYVVIDALSNVDEFLRYANDDDNVATLMANYYGYRALAFFDRISPVLAMIAAMFTLTWIQRHNELTALMAAGISRRRVIRPILAAAVAISIGTLLCRELVIPGFRQELSRDARDLAGENAQPITKQYDNITGIVIGGEHKFGKDQRIHNPSFVLPRSIDPLMRPLVARDCYWKPPDGIHPSGYHFVGVISPLEILQGPSLKLDDQVVVFTPAGEPQWLQKDQCFVVSQLDFDQLAGVGTWWQFSSLGQMIERSRSPSVFFNGSLRVAIHSRVVQPFLDVAMLFLGLPLVLTRENRNMFVAIGLCVLMVAAFMLITLACQYLGASGLLEPAAGAWLPLMIFVPLAVYLFDRIER